MGELSIRVLVVDDYGPWFGFVSIELQKRPELRVIGQASNGLEAVQKAAELQPDLILLDIGLPALNGIEAARQIRSVSPASKILFVSENRAPDVVEQALRTGAGGYVVKSHAGRELLAAIEAVIHGKLFLSAALRGQDFSTIIIEQSAAAHSHEVAFYEDDNDVVDGYSWFIESALKMGKVVILVATESHRKGLLPRLEEDGVDVPAAITQGRFVVLDANDILSKLTVNDMPDPARCSTMLRDLITKASEVVDGSGTRVVFCGEIAPTLLAQGNAEGAIELEHLWDEITRVYGAHTLCGYPRSAFGHEANDPVMQKICAEHSAVRNLGY